MRDKAGNSLRKAKNLRKIAIPGSVKARDSLGPDDQSDIYRFKVRSSADVDIQLSKLKKRSNVDLELFALKGKKREVFKNIGKLDFDDLSKRDIRRNLQRLFSSKKRGKKDEAIATSFEPGLYFVRAYHRKGQSSYRLQLTASLPGNNPNPVPTGQRLLATPQGQIGFYDGVSQFTPTVTSTLEWGDIAVTNTGEVFATDFSDLYKVDLTGKVVSKVGSLNSQLFNGLTTDSNGNLYGTAGSGFYQINKTTGTASLIASISGFFSSGDIVFDPASNQFFATSGTPQSSADTLYAIAPNGDARIVGSIGFSRVYGLAIDNGQLLGYTNNRLELVIDRNTGVGTFKSTIVGGVGEIWGAA